MLDWPATRITLLDRLSDPQDHEAWTEFVALYGPLAFTFARRRLPQDDDAADVVQEVLSVVMRGRYQRPKGRFQKWLITVLLNKIRDYHASRARRCERADDARRIEDVPDVPSPGDEEEWDQERERRLFRVAAERVQARANPIHWEVFVRTALENRSGPEVAAALNLSLTNTYAIKSRIIKEIKDEVHGLGDDSAVAHECVVGDPQAQPIWEKATMAPCIHVERMMHRSSIAVLGDSAAAYALVKLIPAGLGKGRTLGLNLALAVDVSGSMYEEDGTGVSRLQRVQDSILGALERLRPTDTLAIVGFAQNALVLLQGNRIKTPLRLFG